MSQIRNEILYTYSNKEIEDNELYYIDNESDIQVSDNEDEINFRNNINNNNKVNIENKTNNDKGQNFEEQR
ncbi:4067_t:CDS:2 [Diversispora eburnea]|uniref:4067_t:CDS:1 n=1 Tax=Diversispora eburnea TaxID=1213867 RepID=A0A9N9FJQ9_9GLOM|nr:4067_t:CDS:2 [Diversispora eburnea]